jgi:hypothetical protein
MSEVFYVVGAKLLLAGIVRCSSCGSLLWEVGSLGRDQFRNPEEGERQLLKADTKQRLV